MASELAQAIQQVCDDKKIALEPVLETIESALAAAYRKDFGNKLQNIKVKFDMETGDFKVHDIKEVVEDELKEEYERIKEEKMRLAELEEAGNQSSDSQREESADSYRKFSSGGKSENREEKTDDGAEEVKRFNPKMMISLSEAKEIKKKVKIGDELVQKLSVEGDFGRMAAQTAKQVIIQKLREAERDTILNEYRDKIGELLTGTVQRIEGGVVLIDFGNVTAIMPLEEGIRTEKYSPGARFKFYLKNVEESSRGPKVIVSRTHPDILRKLFKLEVPEVASGTVQIKSIAREAGSRSKVAVAAKEEAIDPIGSCIGQRGTRVQTIINEIGGEKVDIIEWQEDPIKFIAKALAPAKIIRVEIKGQEDTKLRKQESKKARKQENKGDDEAVEEEKEVGAREERSGIKEAVVYVVGDQLSLAIGKEGQNVRLAAKLTGWKIDIVEEKFDEDENQESKKTKKQENKTSEDSEDSPPKGDPLSGDKSSKSSEDSKSSESSDEDKKEEVEDDKKEKREKEQKISDQKLVIKEDQEKKKVKKQESKGELEEEEKEKKEDKKKGKEKEQEISD